MKKLVVVLILSSVLFACGDPKTIEGVNYPTYGLINESSKKSDKIEYEPIRGNIVWGAILVGTIAAPIYFYGFSMYEPIEVKNHTNCIEFGCEH